MELLHKNELAPLQVETASKDIKVTVQGKEMSLHDVHQDDIDNMTSEEYDAYTALIDGV